jgi:FMN reductase
MDIATVYGTAAPPGRLWTALQQFGSALSGAAVRTIDLHDVPVDWADGRPLDESSAATRDAVGVLSRSAAVVLFAPVYRAAMPGALKNLLDQTPLDVLHGKVLGLVAMGASPHHYLAIDHEVRRLAAWFGAVVPPTSVYLASSSFADGELTPRASEELQEYAQSVTLLTTRLDGYDARPRPLAASGR